MESTIDKTLHHIIFLARHLKKWDLRGAIIVVLMELGVPTKCVGFELLKHCIFLQNEDGTRALANDIYLETTIRYKQNSERQVEQAVRDVIQAAWKHGSKKAWEWYFSYDERPLVNKPTNSEFISRIAYILELWQECKKEEVCYERE